MSGDHVYAISEVVGSSEESADGAIRNAVDRAHKTLRHLDWFEVKETRGTFSGDGSIARFQVTLRLGFRLEDPPA